MSVQQVLLLQGAGPRVHDDWDDRLEAGLRSLLGPEVEVRYPRLPGEDEPDLPTWAAAIRGELAACDAGVAVVAHSVGGTVLMSALAAPPPVRIGAIVLIAPPFLGSGGWPDDAGALPEDLAERLPEAPIDLVHGLADEVVPPGHADAWERLVPAIRVHRLPGRDHQLDGELTEVAALLRGHRAGGPASRRRAVLGVVSRRPWPASSTSGGAEARRRGGAEARVAGLPGRVPSVP